MDVKTRPIPMIPRSDPLHIERHTEMESKGMEKDIALNWEKQQRSLGSNRVEPQFLNIIHSG